MFATGRSISRPGGKCPWRCRGLLPAGAGDQQWQPHSQPRSPIRHSQQRHGPRLETADGTRVAGNYEPTCVSSLFQILNSRLASLELAPVRRLHVPCVGAGLQRRHSDASKLGCIFVMAMANRALGTAEADPMVASSEVCPQWMTAVRWAETSPLKSCAPAGGKNTVPERVGRLQVACYVEAHSMGKSRSERGTGAEELRCSGPSLRCGRNTHGTARSGFFRHVTESICDSPKEGSVSESL